jgi:hypothetical protein
MKKTDFNAIYSLLLLIISNTSEVEWIKITFGLLSISFCALYIYQLIKGEDER